MRRRSSFSSNGASSTAFNGRLAVVRLGGADVNRAALDVVDDQILVIWTLEGERELLENFCVFDDSAQLHGRCEHMCDQEPRSEAPRSFCVVEVFAGTAVQKCRQL